MGAYVVARLLQLVPLILGMACLNFILIHVAPGNPIIYLVGEFGGSQELIATYERDLGLDKPLYEQLALYIWNVMRGNLGYSYFYRKPVLDVILERVPATLLLMSTQFVLFAILGIFLGVLASKKKKNSLTDNVISTVSLIGYSMPIFWSGQMLMLLFGIQLRWLPVSGMVSMEIDQMGVAYVLDILRHLVLPVTALTFIHVALIVRLLRSSMLDVYTRDYIITARAKGLDENKVSWGHAFPNALLPVVTILGLYLGAILAGAILTETVFAWPGIGRLMYDSISRRDYPVVMGVFLITSISVVIANLFTDTLYAYLDPRIRIR
jgi:peptide/nickel transport system permease protein